MREKKIIPNLQCLLLAVSFTSLRACFFCLRARFFLFPLKYVCVLFFAVLTRERARPRPCSHAGFTGCGSARPESRVCVCVCVCMRACGTTTSCRATAEQGPKLVAFKSKKRRLAPIGSWRAGSQKYSVVTVKRKSRPLLGSFPHSGREQQRGTAANP
jgi:hypothetical protein